MSETSLRFGTSGVRGLAAELDGIPAYAYTVAFLDMLRERRLVQSSGEVLLGRDLRSSSESIARRCCAAVADAGLMPVDCGALPTPALAMSGIEDGSPAIMVTGSHIPADRNGLKFYRPDGEIDKRDEAEISARYAAFDFNSMVEGETAAAPRNRNAAARYAARYLEFFPSACLAGLRVGIYQHSSVARDLLVDVLEALGARTVALGRAPRFVPVDTEAVSADDIAAARNWAAELKMDALVSADGDADRPLIADGSGRFLRGDLVGAITARYLGADVIVTPVTSNSALESCGLFGQVLRTRVGSPFVIEGMRSAMRTGGRKVVGFEANGGVLLGTPVERHGRTLAALPTRDALLPILCTLAASADGRLSLARTADAMGFKASAADRLKDIPAELSAPFLRRLAQDKTYGRELFAGHIRVAGIDAIDGVRVTTAKGEVVHYRASGNAPELRCYVEAADKPRADFLLAWGLDVARQQILGGEQT